MSLTSTGSFGNNVNEDGALPPLGTLVALDVAEFSVVVAKDMVPFPSWASVSLGAAAESMSIAVVEDTLPARIVSIGAVGMFADIAEFVALRTENAPESAEI
jgi:hypothetical protein